MEQMQRAIKTVTTQKEKLTTELALNMQMSRKDPATQANQHQGPVPKAVTVST